MRRKSTNELKDTPSVIKEMRNTPSVSTLAHGGPSNQRIPPVDFINNNMTIKDSNELDMIEVIKPQQHGIKPRHSHHNVLNNSEIVDLQTKKPYQKGKLLTPGGSPMLTDAGGKTYSDNPLKKSDAFVFRGGLSTTQMSPKEL